MGSVASIDTKKEIKGVPLRKLKRLGKTKSKAKIIHIEIAREAVQAVESMNEPEVAGEELVLKYRVKARKLARSILRRWHARLDLQEVDSIVDLSLCEAMVRFDPTKGASFMTFLFYHLRGNLIRAVSVAASMNMIPFSSCDSAFRNANSSDPEQVGGRGANALEVAEALSSQEYLLPDELLLKKEMIAMSSRACAALDPLEREIIERIYMQEQQLMDIAHLLGYSRCHISRVKKKALEALQGELSKTLGVEISASAGDEEGEGSHAERRKVFRRRPRSKAALRQRAVKGIGELEFRKVA